VMRTLARDRTNHMGAQVTLRGGPLH
jgi:hypothetical protein